LVNIPQEEVNASRPLTAAVPSGESLPAVRKSNEHAPGESVTLQRFEDSGGSSASRHVAMTTELKWLVFTAVFVGSGSDHEARKAK
jgi:hypothetical protein